MKKTDILLYLFILLLPIQLGKHFFPPFTFISGVPIDYIAPTLYLTDILAVLLIVLNMKTVLTFFRNKIVIGFLLLLGINIVFAMSQPIALYKSVKILEVLGLFAIFRKAKLNPKFILTSFAIGACFELSLAVAQFIQRQSMQGIFYYFGERNFILSTPNIAKASINGAEFLRPYATFSHPNSLAGFYLLIYVCVLTFPVFKKYIYLKNLLMLLCSMLILISFSKLAIGTYLLLSLTFLFKHRKELPCKMCLIGRPIIILIVAAIFISAHGDVDSLEKRMILIDNSITTFVSQPIVGVGMGNYLLAEVKFPSKYPYFFLQPVHNIFLLFLTEAGLLLAGYAGYFLYKWITALIVNETFLYAFCAVVITGMFDHYWLTLQQNLLLLPVIFGIIVHGQIAKKIVQ